MEILKKTLCIAVVAAAFAGCTANGGFPGADGNGGGGNGGGASGNDADGDGVDDNFDLCPGTAEGAVVNAIGCSTDQFGTAIPSGFKCTDVTSGTATAGPADGNLCGLGQVLDPVLGLVLGTETCSVTDPENAGDGNIDSFANLQFTATLLDPNTIGFGAGDPIDGNVFVNVAGPSGGAGSLAAFDLEVPGGSVDAGVLDGIIISTYLDGAFVEGFTTGEDGSLDGFGVLALDVLGLIGGSDRFAAGFIASAPYNEVRVTASSSLLGAEVGLDSSEGTVYAYDVCTAAAIVETP